VTITAAVAHHRQNTISHTFSPFFLSTPSFPPPMSCFLTFPGFPGWCSPWLVRFSSSRPTITLILTHSVQLCTICQTFAFMQINLHNTCNILCTNCTIASLLSKCLLMCNGSLHLPDSFSHTAINNVIVDLSVSWCRVFRLLCVFVCL